MLSETINTSQCIFSCVKAISDWNIPTCSASSAVDDGKLILWALAMVGQLYRLIVRDIHRDHLSQMAGKASLYALKLDSHISLHKADELINIPVFIKMDKHRNNNLRQVWAKAVLISFFAHEDNAMCVIKHYCLHHEGH